MNTDTSDFEALTHQITTSSQTLITYLNENDNYLPSFQQGGFTDFEELPPEIEIERKRLVSATKAVHDLALGPREFVKNLARSYHDTSTLRWLMHYKIFETVPLARGTSIRYEDVAKKCGVDEGILRRVVKYAMTNRMFYEPNGNKDEIAHTAYSAVLASNEEFEGLEGVESDVEEGFRASTKLVEACEGGMRKSAFQLGFGTEMGFEEYQATSQDEGARDSAVEEECLMNAYPWDRVKRVVDVGGGKGETAIAMAKKFPKLRIVVQDSSEKIEMGQQELPKDLERKVFFVGHGIAEEHKAMPDEVFGAQVYLLRNVLSRCMHERAKKILGNLAEVLQDEEGSRCLIMDRVLPSPTSASGEMEMEQKGARHLDLQALELFNGAERNREEWETLLKDADENLKLVDIREMTGSAYSLLEVSYNDG